MSDPVKIFDGDENLEQLKADLLRAYILDTPRDYIKANKRAAQSIDQDNATPQQLMAKAIADYIPQRRDCVLRRRKS